MKKMNLKELKEPFVIILIGPPLSGKTTWIKENFPDTKVISRDEILMEVYGSRNYDEAFDKVDQKLVNKKLNLRIREANNKKENVILDMMHMRSKRRRIHLNYFSKNYFKLGVLFPILTDEEYIKRNEIRKQEENKNINIYRIKEIMKQYQTISSDEGFDKVITL